MTTQYMIRIDAYGTIGRFTAEDQAIYERGMRVVCRTPRGLEIGEVLVPAVHTENDAASDGALVRQLTAHDESRLVTQAAAARSSD